MNIQAMKRFILVLLPILLLGLFAATIPTRAMPEYATQVGEPCASCHVSPAGGGMRNVRGQAWVAEGKPAEVPSTLAALQILGVQLPSDMSIYSNAPAVEPAPAPLQVEPGKLAPLMLKLLDYVGN